MMSRRRFLCTLSVSLLAAPLSAEAQQTRKVHHIGYLGYGSPAASANRVEALRAGLRDLGYVEGKNLVIEFRWARTVEQLNEAAAELARMKVDIIFATSSTESEPARRATSTIPIVFATHADPESAGHVASLARPGGNMTGLADIQTGITPKRLEILKVVVPRATRFGVLWTPTAPSGRPFVQAAEATGGKLGLQLLTLSVSTVAEFEGAFAKFVGVAEAHHDLSHHGGNAEKREKLAKIDAYNVSTFAKFVEKLSKTQDGDGSLLDRSIMLFGSSLSDGDMHSPLDLPTVIAGGGNGTLKGNQHLRWAEDKKVPMANLYTTLLDKIGVHIDKLGDSSGELVEL